MSAYSNWGAALAAFIVEQISGQDYATFERDHVLLPSNMQNTLNQPDWFGNETFLANKAIGYLSDGVGGFQAGMWTYIPIYPTGAINGTAEDLAAFLIALTPPAGESGPLFSDANTLGTLFTPSSLDLVYSPGTHHGFLQYPGVLPAFGHGGGTAAFLTDFVLVPEARFGFVLLTNSTGGMGLISAIGDLLLGSPPAPVAGSNLPNAQAVEGHFFSTRRYAGNFLEFFPYAGLSNISMIQIRALDENRIQLLFGPLGSAVYVQTEPYVFHRYDTSDTAFASSFPHQLRVQMEDGVPQQIHVDNGNGFTALPAGRTMPFLIASLVIAALSAAFFLIVPVILLIAFLIRRKKQERGTRFNRFHTGFLLSGTLLVLNQSVIAAHFGLNPFRSASELAPYIWMNYVFAGLAAFLFAGAIWSWRTGETKRKVLFVITVVFVALLTVLLHNWNFFALL